MISLGNGGFPPYTVHCILLGLKTRVLGLCRYDASEFRERVRHSTTYTDVPQLSEEFIHTNLRHMAALNIISYH